MSFSPDGKWLASCGDDRVIRISPIDGGEPYLLEGPPAKLMSLVYLGSREVAAGGSDNLIRIWDLDTRAEHSQLAAHSGTVIALAYANETLVSAGYDTTVRVWKRLRNVAGEPAALPPRVGQRDGDVGSR
jgi:WD40 repeat protein